MKKLLSSRGETLIESLCAVLIVTLVMLFLSTAIATAARVNHRVRTTDVSFQTGGTATPDRTVTVTVGGTTYTGKATTYDTTNGYRYYRYQGVTQP
ncbi:MAG: hypothetical protein SOZ90_03395 [Candidatus Faecousia sp.]|nr:hypothetical protein [Candidatus Faecousia sp.]